MEPKPPPKTVSNQDWTQLYFYKSKPANQKTTSDQKTYISSKSRALLDLERIDRSQQNEKIERLQKQRSEKSIRPTIKKEEYEGPDYTVKTVGVAWAKKLVQARNNKGISQKELAMAIQEKVTVVQDYERGTAIPHRNVISKMEKALGVKL